MSLAHVLLTTDVRTELITCTPVDPRLAELAGIDPSEYNRDTDTRSAEAVQGSGILTVQVPLRTYERMKVSLAEISLDLATPSPVGAWLAERLLDVPPFVTLSGILTLGDTALASVVGLDPAFGREGGSRGGRRRHAAAVSSGSRSRLPALRLAPVEARRGFQWLRRASIP